jgi:hypothetical protein
MAAAIVAHTTTFTVLPTTTAWPSLIYRSRLVRRLNSSSQSTATTDSNSTDKGSGTGILTANAGLGFILGLLMV